MGQKKLPSPGKLLFTTVLYLFMAEAAVMVALSFLPPLSTASEAIVDAVALTIASLPILYFSLFKPLSAMINERREKEKIIARNLQVEEVLNKLLHLSLEDISLTELLEKFVENVTDLPWLGLEPKGAVFLVSTDEPDTLRLAAHRNLNSSLLDSCASVSFGHCLCGKAALRGEVVFEDCLTDDHQTRRTGVDRGNWSHNRCRHHRIS